VRGDTVTIWPTARGSWDAAAPALLSSTLLLMVEIQKLYKKSNKNKNEKETTGD
jgi:hypothetical protein